MYALISKKKMKIPLKNLVFVVGIGALANSTTRKTNLKIVSIGRARLRAFLPGKTVTLTVSGYRMAVVLVETVTFLLAVGAEKARLALLLAEITLNIRIVGIFFLKKRKHSLSKQISLNFWNFKNGGLFKHFFLYILKQVPTRCNIKNKP